MKHLFLTSSIGTKGVGDSIRKHLGHKRILKTVFITTPIETKDEQKDLSWYEEDREMLHSAGFDYFDYTITGKDPEQIKKDLFGIEAIYITGGNTNYLLEQSQKSGFTSIVQSLVEQGIVYVSTSAGSIIAGPEIPPYLWDDESGAPNLSDYSAYKLVNFTILPHWGSHHFKNKYLSGRIEQIYKRTTPFILLNDSQYVEVDGDSCQIVDISKE